MLAILRCEFGALTVPIKEAIVIGKKIILNAITAKTVGFIWG